jgi:hypothetical protein
MTTQKRPAFWQLPAALQSLPEAKLHEESIGADTVLLHITFPRGTDPERVSNFARAFTRELPKNVRAIFTEEDIAIHVHRPRTVSLQIMNNTIEGDDLLRQIDALVKDPDIHQVQLAIHGNLIQKSAQSPAQPGTGTLSGGNGKQVAGEKPRRRGTRTSTTAKSVQLVKEK